jgi:hypothetical protein
MADGEFMAIIIASLELERGVRRIAIIATLMPISLAGITQHLREATPRKGGGDLGRLAEMSPAKLSNESPAGLESASGGFEYSNRF